MNSNDKPGVMRDAAGKPVMQTVSGHLVSVIAPTTDEVRVALDDMGVALSRLCRYNGHSARFYSVLEHEVRACDLYLSQRGFKDHNDPLLRYFRHHARVAYGILHHDHHEGVVGDRITPLKVAAAQVGENQGGGDPFSAISRQLEASFGRALCLRGVAEDAALVKRADIAITAVEKRDLMAAGGHQWPGLGDPDPNHQIGAEDPTMWVLNEFATMLRNTDGDGRLTVRSSELRRCVERAIALRPETILRQWCERRDALQLASVPRPTASGCSREIAAEWLWQARKAGAASNVIAPLFDGNRARDPDRWSRWIASWTSPVDAYRSVSDATKCYEQLVYNVCEATFHAIRRSVVDLTHAWVRTGCAPCMEVYQRGVILAERCNIGPEDSIGAASFSGLTWVTRDVDRENAIVDLEARGPAPMEDMIPVQMIRHLK